MYPLLDLAMVTSKTASVPICHAVNYFLGSCSLVTPQSSYPSADVDTYNTSVLLVSMFL